MVFPAVEKVTQLLFGNQVYSQTSGIRTIHRICYSGNRGFACKGRLL